MAKGQHKERKRRNAEKTRTLTSVDAEYPVVDDDREGEEVEHVGKVLPHGRAAVFPHAFRIEPVRLTEKKKRGGKTGIRFPSVSRSNASPIRPHLCDCATLVVPSDELDAVRIPQFQTGQERDGLDAEQASVDAEEEVIGMGRVASYPKDLDQVVELAGRRGAECRWPGWRGM